ncbi:MAG: hypothetical protein ACR2IT_06860, partial [Pirellulales bacterium]
LPILVRIDIRRPASWISLTLAVIAAAVVARLDATPQALSTAIACGGLEAIAAVGAVTAGNATLRTGTVWYGRVAWPIAGAVVGAAVLLLAPPSGDWSAPIALIASTTASGWVVHRVACAGGAPAPAASMALVMAALAAAAASIPSQLVWSAVAAIGCWGVLAIASLTLASLRRGEDTTTMPRPRDGHGTILWHADVPRLPHGTSFLDRVAMASTLAAMVACFFLAREHAWWYAVIAAAWFVALAGPAATVAAGDADAGRRALLVRSAPGRPRAPGSLPDALTTIGFYASILGWPAVVAAVLWGAKAADPQGPLAAVAVLAAIAVGLAAAAALSAGAALLNRGAAVADTTLAVVMIAAMAALLALEAASPASPSLRSSALGERGESLGSRC